MHHIEIGDKLILRKQHPCGSKQWEVWKLGMDIGIRCLNCGRMIKIPRAKLEKYIVEPDRMRPALPDLRMRNVPKFKWKSS